MSWVRRPWWTYRYDDPRRYIGRERRLAMAAWRVKAGLTGACVECGLLSGQHKLSCDTAWRQREAKRRAGGLNDD